LGAATELRENLGTDGGDQWVVAAGATFGWEAWTIGLGWSRGDYEGAVGVNGVGPFNARHDIYAFTASYALGPGIILDGVVEHSDYDSDDPAGPDHQGLAAGIGTLIRF
jgi:predicted porin